MLRWQNILNLVTLYFFTNTQKPEGSEDSQCGEGLECDNNKLGRISEDLALGSWKLTPPALFKSASHSHVRLSSSTTKPPPLVFALPASVVSLLTIKPFVWGYAQQPTWPLVRISSHSAPCLHLFLHSGCLRTTSFPATEDPHSAITCLQACLGLSNHIHCTLNKKQPIPYFIQVYVFDYFGLNKTNSV